MAKILIVDNSEYSRSVLRRDLEASGKRHQFIEEKTGIDAIKRIEATPDIDVIFVNPTLPQMDGMTLVEKINQLPRAKRCAVVMVSSESNEFLKGQARSLGVRAWIVKPCSRDHLLSALERVLRPAVAA